MTSELTLKVRNELSQLEPVGRALEVFGRDAALPARLVSSLTLAVDEILTNVVSYAFERIGKHEIEVRALREGDEVVVEIEDDGKPFDPLSVPAPRLDAALEDRSVGGLGLPIVRKLVDTIAYRRAEGHNTLSLRFRIGHDEALASGPARAEGLMLSESDEQGSWVVTIRGHLGASGAVLVDKTVRAHIARGTRRIVIDCAGLNFIGSAGLRSLLVAAKRLKKTHGRIALAALQPQVAEVFEISGLAPIFTLYRNVEEAIAGKRG